MTNNKFCFSSKKCFVGKKLEGYPVMIISRPLISFPRSSTRRLSGFSSSKLGETNKTISFTFVHSQRKRLQGIDNRNNDLTVGLPPKVQYFGTDKVENAWETMHIAFRLILEKLFQLTLSQSEYSSWKRSPKLETLAIIGVQVFDNLEQTIHWILMNENWDVAKPEHKMRKLIGLIRNGYLLFYIKNTNSLGFKRTP